jgi:hypothetical protein
VESFRAMQERDALIASGPPARGVGAIGRAAMPRVSGPGWVYLYIAIEIGCQLALLSEALSPARVVFRSMAVGANLLMLLVIPGRPVFQHPSRNLAFFILTVVTLSALNPSGSTLQAAMVHWAFYLAVIAPVFWVMRLELTESVPVRVITLLWLYGTLSASFGILQVYFPGQFEPAISSQIRPERALMIRLSSGALVVRPMGLTDLPGGAAVGGLHAALFGLGMALTKPFRGAAVAGVTSMVIGITCIYLSHVRSGLVTLAICCVVLLIVLAASGRLSRLVLALVIGAFVAVLGFEVAFSLSDSVAARFGSLLADDPGTVYRVNRGSMIEHALFELLPQYPLGGGLGRWGMVNLYFGRFEDLLPVEVQWAGWVADGGLPLLLLYPAAVVTAIWAAVRAAIAATTTELGVMAAIVAAYGVGTLALTFSYAVFMSTGGIQFWLLSAVLLRSIASKRGARGVLDQAR